MSLNTILQDVLRGNLNAGELSRQLRRYSISPEEYNQALFSVFSYRFSGNISDVVAGVQIGPEGRPGEDLSLLNAILEEFYKIENCPSFLYHRAMLDVEDYAAVFQVYSQIFGLERDGDEVKCEWMKKQFEEYAGELIKKCAECKSEDEFLRVVHER